MQLLMRLGAVKQKCSPKEASVECRGRVVQAPFRGMARQLERGFPDINDEVVKVCRGLCFM